MGIFANCHSLASARKNDLWQFLFWILSILMCIQNFIKISDINEEQRRFPFFFFFFFFFFFTFFASALPWSQKSGICQAYWLDLVGIYQCAKNYQNFLNVVCAMAIFAFWQTDSRGDYRALYESQPFHRSTFLQVMQYLKKKRKKQQQ